MSKIQKIKQHIRNNKVTYVACGVTAVVVAGVTYYITRNGAASVALVNNSNHLNGVVNWKTNQTIEVIVEALGDPGNIVQDVTTGTIYASQGQAARALGVSASAISKQLNGDLKDVSGHVFEKLGKAAVVAA